MLRALRTAALGMSAQQMGVDNIANNLANANTTAFKRQTIVFQDLLYQTVQAPGEGEGNGAAPPATLQMGHGATAVATVRNFVQAGLADTENPYDIAINGEGFFQITRPDGSVAYTRDGTLTMSAEGMLVTQGGLPLEPEVSIPPEATAVVISPDGRVQVSMPGESTPVEIGQIELARFTNPSGLRSIGDNLYEETNASGEPVIGAPGQDGIGAVRQGFVENSNVQVVREMVNLISAQRAYELNAKLVTTADEMLRQTNQLKR